VTTELQAKMLKAIATNELTPLNGAEPNSHEDATTYADMVIEDAQDKGVFTSLLNAELVWHSGKGRDAVVGLTAKGFAEYKNL
jgi:hypothetical protein